MSQTYDGATTALTSHPTPVAAPCAGCAEYQILVENLKFRLKMAEDSNPDNVLSKHNAMLMAVDNADHYKAECEELRGKLEVCEMEYTAMKTDHDACHRQHEQCMKLLEQVKTHLAYHGSPESAAIARVIGKMLSKGELPEGTL